MFSRISLQPSDIDIDQARIATQIEMARKGARSRIAYAMVMGACSLLWLPAWIAAIYVVAAFCWEEWGRAWATARGVAVLRTRRQLRYFHRALIFLAACAYAFLPATGVLSGQLIGWHLAMMAFCSAVVVGVTYFSNDAWQFGACILPSTIVACFAPFVFDAAPHIIVVVLALAAMFIGAALQSALHRAELVESIAKKEAARSKAENASVEKSQFVANVSHELRTPLNAIIGYSEMLREDAAAEGRRGDQADLDHVLCASRRLLSLINELLDLSKIEAGKITLEAGWYDVGEMLAAAVATARPMVEANGNKITLELQPGLGRGQSDEFRLSQCVLNLLSNAAKFTRDGEIVVRARRGCWGGREHFLISVSDTGVGIAPDAVQQLFQPFAQADASITRQFGGTGLGLALTRRLALMLGGDVWVESEPGKGSTFTLATPVQACAEATAPEDAPLTLAQVAI